MLVKFKRRHRFSEVGEIREVPDHIGERLVQSGIVVVLKEDEETLKTRNPENKAIKNSVRSSSVKRKKKNRAD